MRKKNQHLTYSDRDMIERFYNIDHFSTRKIAELLHCHWNTINNELKRGYYEHLNSDYTITIKYSADKAQSDYEYQSTAKGRDIKLGNDKQLADYLAFLIKRQRYSPYAALEKAKIKFNIKQPFCVRTLYSYIEKGYFDCLTVKDLPEHGTRKKKCTKEKKQSKKLPRYKSIENRPAEVWERSSVGHWEMDTLQGKRDGKNETVLVLTERKSRYEITYKLPDKTAASVVNALHELQRLYSFPIKTVTVDNGSEFADFLGIESALCADLFYCHPYCSAERGSNERQNRMLRRWLPKGSSFNRVTNEQLNKIERWLNNYPRKIFNGYTAADIFSCEKKLE